MITSLSSDQIHRHHLEGYVYSTSGKSEYNDLWKRQMIKNHLFWNEMVALEGHFKDQDIEVVLLKGFALLGPIYEDWGARFTSDVDILIKPKDMSSTTFTLEKNGFTEQLEEKWLGNNFKKIFSKKTGLVECTIEVHTRLYWHSLNSAFESVTKEPDGWYRVLEPEGQLLHLCGHLAFQHTFIKLFWLYDIELFLNKRARSLDWNKFWTLCKELELLNSAQICLSLVGYDHYLMKKKSRRHWFLKKLCNEPFLLAPRAHPIRYYLIKFFIKDRLILNFSYLRAWLGAKNGLKAPDF